MPRPPISVGIGVEENADYYVLKMPPRGSIASRRHESASKLTENVE